MGFFDRFMNCVWKKRTEFLALEEIDATEEKWLKDSLGGPSD